MYYTVRIFSWLLTFLSFFAFSVSTNLTLSFLSFQLSKEVKKLREYEEGLLKYYQRYLQILEETVQGKQLCF